MNEILARDLEAAPVQPGIAVLRIRDRVADLAAPLAGRRKLSDMTAREIEPPLLAVKDLVIT